MAPIVRLISYALCLFTASVVAAPRPEPAELLRPVLAPKLKERHANLYKTGVSLSTTTLATTPPAPNTPSSPAPPPAAPTTSSVLATAPPNTAVTSPPPTAALGIFGSSITEPPTAGVSTFADIVAPSTAAPGAAGTTAVAFDRNPPATFAAAPPPVAVVVPQENGPVENPGVNVQAINPPGEPEAPSITPPVAVASSPPVDNPVISVVPTAPASALPAVVSEGPASSVIAPGGPAPSVVTSGGPAPPIVTSGASEPSPTSPGSPTTAGSTPVLFTGGARRVEGSVFGIVGALIFGVML